MKTHTLNDDGDRVQIAPTIHAQTGHGRRVLLLVWRKAGTRRWYHRLLGVYPEDEQRIALTKADIAKIAAIDW